MILGDSLNVMACLAEREKLRGKVQMVYIDPPYGKFGLQLAAPPGTEMSTMARWRMPLVRPSRSRRSGTPGSLEFTLPYLPPGPTHRRPRAPDRDRIDICPDR